MSSEVRNHRTRLAPPPGPRGLRAILDVVKQRKRDPLALYLNLIKTHGDLVYFKIGGIGYCLVNDPESIQYVLQSNQKNYPKGPGYERLRMLLGYGLLTNEGESWRRQRKLAAPAFLRERIVEFSRQVAPLADAMIKGWEGRAEINIASEMNRITMQVVGETLLGSDPTSRAAEISQSLLAVLKFSDKRGMSWLRIIDIMSFGKDRNLAFKIEKHLPTAANRQFQNALRILNELIQGVIERRRQAVRQTGEYRQDFLGLFMAAHDEDDGTQMTDRQLRDEIMSIFVAGHETTATAITWTLYLLAKNPETRVKLQAEIDHELKGRAPNFEDLTKLRYVHHVFDEALRYYPPFWRVTRQAVTEDSMSGFRIPAGTVMIISPYATHRNLKFWPSPEVFRPERFADEDSKARHKFAYLPFGGGARACIGSNFAVMEALMILVRICQNYELDVLPRHPVQFVTDITLRSANGMPMALRPRKLDEAIT